MEDEIARVLEASMSPDEATRVNAEQQLTQGGTMPGFGLALVRCALNQLCAPGTRQLAAVVLKKYVKETQPLTTEDQPSKDYPGRHDRGVIQACAKRAVHDIWRNIKRRRRGLP